MPVQYRVKIRQQVALDTVLLSQANSSEIGKSASARSAKLASSGKT
jgi:hypothetical protein